MSTSRLASCRSSPPISFSSALSSQLRSLYFSKILQQRGPDGRSEESSHIQSVLDIVIFNVVFILLFQLLPVGSTLSSCPSWLLPVKISASSALLPPALSFRQCHGQTIHHNRSHCVLETFPFHLTVILPAQITPDAQGHQPHLVCTLFFTSL